MRDVVQSKVKLFRTVLFIRINLVVKDEMGRKSNPGRLHVDTKGLDLTH